MMMMVEIVIIIWSVLLTVLVDFPLKALILKKDNAAGCRSVPCTMVQTRKRHNWFGNWVDRGKIVCCSNLLLSMEKLYQRATFFFSPNPRLAMESYSKWHVVEPKSHRLFHPDLSPCMVSFLPLAPRQLYIYTYLFIGQIYQSHWYHPSLVVEQCWTHPIFLWLGTSMPVGFLWFKGAHVSRLARPDFNNAKHEPNPPIWNESNPK